MPSLDGALMESLLVQPGRRGARVGHGRRSLAAVPPARQIVRLAAKANSASQIPSKSAK